MDLKQVVKQYKFVIEPTVLFGLYYVEFYNHVCVRTYVYTCIHRERICISLVDMILLL